MARQRFVLGAALLALAAATPLAAQTHDWQYKWFWGAKGGALGYTLPRSGQVFGPQVGAEWVITARRTALYAGYSQSTIQERDYYPFTGISTDIPVIFESMRRIQIAVIVFPTSGAFQPYVGGGFVIETLTNTRADSTLSSGNQTTVDRALQDQSAGGFALVMGGLQLRMGAKLALYGQYQGSPQGRDFLLPGSSHSLEFGLRYAFLAAREDDITSRR
ncbi:MAG: hypothetical protein HYR48_03470 [Gemmatimonadetes bacterium]|nr:hypothetical protein [Gemmatimonadota bacterium]